MTTSETMTAAQEVQDQITALEKQRVKIQQASTAIAQRVAEIQHGLPALRVALSRGDAAAGAAIQKLDAELIALSHAREGHRLSLEDLDREMAPLHAEARQRAVLADMERQAAEVQRITKDVEDHIASALVHHRAACSDFFAISQAPEAARAANLDESHRGMVLAAIERANNRVVAATAAIVNENWMRAPYGPRELKIVAANPGAKAR